jgi:hypothetical protein
MPDGGYVLENGISLCNDCHFEAERYYNDEAEGFNDELPKDGFGPRDLFGKIGVSDEVASKLFMQYWMGNLYDESLFDEEK